MSDMKNKLPAILAALCALVLTAAATDYRPPPRWAVCEANKPGAAFDIFYLPPTLFCNPLKPLMDIDADRELRNTIAVFSSEQCQMLAPGARVFSPFVRMLDYSYISWGVCAPGGWRRFDMLDQAVDDACEAFKYYLRHFNKGRPYILFGHSQGAMILYLMMRRTPEISVRRGFVAAYLIGMPHLTTGEITSDLRPRGIRPARRADDIGVVIGWNTQRPGVNNIFFTKRGTYCINPLNWRTDATPAEAKAHLGALIYDRRKRRYRTVKHLGGARIDTRYGALIFDPQPEERYSARGFAGSGVLHMYDVWFFVVNLRENIALRARKWLETYGGAK